MTAGWRGAAASGEGSGCCGDAAACGYGVRFDHVWICGLMARSRWSSRVWGGGEGGGGLVWCRWGVGGDGWMGPAFWLLAPWNGATTRGAAAGLVEAARRDVVSWREGGGAARRVPLVAVGSARPSPTCRRRWRRGSRNAAVDARAGTADSDARADTYGRVARWRARRHGLQRLARMPAQRCYCACTRGHGRRNEMADMRVASS